MTEKPQNARHALYIGWILGLAMRHGLPFHAETDEDGDYVSTLRLDLTPEVTVRLVVPPPPDDWTFTGPPPPDDWTSMAASR